MTGDEFIFVYWSHYISLEKEFVETIHYLSIDSTNDLAYSQAYAKLMLEIGSEVDTVFKEYCKKIDSTFKSSFSKITRYKNSIMLCMPDFINQNVTISVENYKKTLQPWKEWNSLDSPYWWKAYNKIKHERTSIVDIDGVKDFGYKFANQKYTLLGLAGLYQTMVYYYYSLASDEKLNVITPMPNSRIFKLVGGNWDKIQFYGESAFIYDPKNESLNWINSKIHY